MNAPENRLHRMLGKNIPDVVAGVGQRIKEDDPIPLDPDNLPYKQVTDNYTLPVELYAFQQEAVNNLAPLGQAGYYFEQGLGKTLTVIASALYKIQSGSVDKLVVIMPPILILGWKRTLESIPELKGQVEMYRGSPETRKRINLGEKLITLVGIQIFKKDYDRFSATFNNERVFVILDEAQSQKNVSSENHRRFSQFVKGKPFALLTGTPISSPEDAYSYINLLNPGVYRSKAQFMNVHVGHRDFFQRVVSWKNLEIIEKAMRMKARRVLKEDVLKDLPEVTYTPMFYQLEGKHARLYKQLAEEELLVLESGGKIDATSASKLYHALGQIIVNLDHFSGNERDQSTCFELVDQIMDEVGDKKLIIFATYRMSVERLRKHLSKYNAVAVNGSNPASVNEKNLEAFKKDPKVQVLIGQPSSMGAGVDGLQHVCQDILFLEHPPLTAFHQAVARLHRIGQPEKVHIRLAVAEGTLQVDQHERLLNNDSLVNKVIRNVEDLRKVIYGL